MNNLEDNGTGSCHHTRTMTLDEWTTICLDCGVFIETVLPEYHAPEQEQEEYARVEQEEVNSMAGQVQKFGDAVVTQRPSTYDGEQVQVADLIDKTVIIKACKADSDDRGEWADYQVESEGKTLTFITGSGVLVDAAKAMNAKGKDGSPSPLEKGPIEATLQSVKSKTSRFSYYQWA